MRIENGKEMVDKINRRDCWTSKEAIFRAH
jgi:hypothetical protein